MAKTQNFGWVAVMAISVAVGPGNALAQEANDPAGHSTAGLVALERSAYQAWKSKDSKFWDTFLSDQFVGWGSLGRLDKALATKEYTGADCDIKRYALSEEHSTSLSRDVALLTYKVRVDGTCGGQHLPASSRAAGIYVREGGHWKATFHAQAAIVDPKPASVKPAGQTFARVDPGAETWAQDARTDTLLANERAVWEAWKDHDANRIGELTATDISFINIFGTYLANKAEALKNWSGVGCDAKSVGVSDAQATMLSPTVGILTFKATADGTCFGQKVGPVWGSSVYVKFGDVWKWSFGINVPNPQ